MASRITSLCIDCSDTENLAEFWAAVLGWKVKGRGWQSTEHGKDGVSLEAPDGSLEIDFRWVPDTAKPLKNRLHLDINAVDRDQAAEHQRLLSLGATPVDVGQGERSWYVLADLEGNEFCLIRDQVDP